MSDLIHLIDYRSRKFRTMIDVCPKDRFSINLAGFPRACGDVSLLLSRYLQEADVAGVHYISARKGEATHAWLQLGTLIIDITLDQFVEFEEPCLIADVHPWHDDWNAQDMGDADWHKMAGSQANALAADYAIIVAINN